VLEHLTVTTNTSDGGTTVTVYNVASAQVLPGETAVVTTTSGEEFEINQDGLFLVKTISAAAGRRRRLMQTPEEQALADGQGLIVVAQADVAAQKQAEQEAAEAGGEFLVVGVVASGALALLGV